MMFEELLQPDIYSWRRSSGYCNVLNLMNVDRNEISFLIENGTPGFVGDYGILNRPAARSRFRKSPAVSTSRP